MAFARPASEQVGSSVPALGSRRPRRGSTSHPTHVCRSQGVHQRLCCHRQGRREQHISRTSRRTVTEPLPLRSLHSATTVSCRSHALSCRSHALSTPGVISTEILFHALCAHRALYVHLQRCAPEHHVEPDGKASGERRRDSIDSERKERTRTLLNSCRPPFSL